MDHRPWIMKYGLSSIVYGLFNFNHNGLLCIRERKRCPVMRGQHIDAAAAVDAVLVRFVPGALWDIDHTGQDARREAAGQYYGAAFIVFFNFIDAFDAPRLRFHGVVEDSLCESLLQQVVVVMR